MTRVDAAAPPQAYFNKPYENGANFCRFVTLISIAIVVSAAYFILQRPADDLGDPSDQFVVKNIPRIYTKLEGVDPEERDVFQGFRTSFLPHEEIVLARRDRRQVNGKEVYEGNVTSDILIWDAEQQGEPTRMKRMSHFTFTSKDYHEENARVKHKDEGNESETDNNENESEAEEEYESSEQYDDNQSSGDRVVHPEQLDRGPLDDVVEQIRGQPELEEGEMGSSARLYKPSRSYTGIHAFWKGQGDRETIRNTQASIMKQYMDAEADPCHDFYQYACGNWATLNPIPADKAGYDTFEMLRENLDTVLKDLLEFKPHEEFQSVFPGSELDLEDNFLKEIAYIESNADKLDIMSSPAVLNTDPVLNDTTIEPYYMDIQLKNLSKANLIQRIRRYLNKKSKRISQIKSKINNYLSTNINKHSAKSRRKRNLDFVKIKVHKNFAKRKTTPKPTKNNKHKRKIVRRNYIVKSQNVRIGRKLQMHTDAKNQDDIIEKITKELLETVDSKPTPYKDDDPANGDAAMKARFLFKSCMNYDILQRRSHQPLLDLLNLLGGWPILDPKWIPRNFNWLDVMAKLRLYNNDILISEWVGPDIKNSNEFVIQFDQTSLGLPTRDYFLQDANKVYLNAYKNYLVKIAVLLGGENNYVKESSDKLIEFETKYKDFLEIGNQNEVHETELGRYFFNIFRLAKITSAPEDRRNVSELYQRMPLKKLESLIPEIKWRRYLCVVMNRTVQEDETVVLFAFNYVKHLVALINDTEPSVLSNYLLWRFVRHRVNNLDDRFQSAKQQFYFTLFGREQAPPRWKNCISQVNSNMGMALGSMFVRKYFDETSKNDTLTMTRDIQQSFRELLRITDWIDNKTKTLAAHKVDAMMLRIGYPDFILHKKELDERYKEVKIHPDKYFENILNILHHLTRMEQSRLGQPVNKTLWNTAPAVVNAYYSRNKNQIMFPAGILQPPFYHRHFPRSLNYGGIGVVIGHEITHGFDDKGRLFDCDGNLHRWWSDSAIEAFHRRAQCLIDQYGRYVVPEVNMKLDGVNTQGENIADNGGVKQAFRAYLHWLQKHGAEDETLPGLNHTNTQLFFLNFAQVWCGAMRPEAMRNKLKTAVHSPGRFRVIGTLSNSHDFAREFQCPPGSPMNPTHKCTVW